MKTYFIGIQRTWENKENGTFEIDTRDFEVSAEDKKEAIEKAADIAREHGAAWSVSYVEES